MCFLSFSKELAELYICFGWVFLFPPYFRVLDTYHIYKCVSEPGACIQFTLHRALLTH